MLKDSDGILGGFLGSYEAIEVLVLSLKDSFRIFGILRGFMGLLRPLRDSFRILNDSEGL